MSSIPLAISMVTGLGVGTMTTVVFAFYVLLQALILKKDFKLKSLLQLLFGTVFGFFLDIANQIVAGLTPSGYMMQLLFLIISIAFVGIGVVFVITMDIAPGAPEGLMLAICSKTGIAFHKMKTGFDSTSVVVAAIISFIFAGHIGAIGEGTIISAIAIGKVAGMVMPHLEPKLKKIAFHPIEKEESLYELEEVA